MKHLIVAMLFSFTCIFGAVGLGMYFKFLTEIIPLVELFLLTALAIAFGLFFNELALHTETKKKLAKLERDLTKVD